MRKILALSLLFLILFSCNNPKPVQTNFDKELAWWKEARYGLFIHWGLSSLMGKEISWSRNSYGAEKYDRLAKRFNPVEFDADKWITIAENAGMKYIVLTTKHHDGYCLWDSKVNSHNIMNSPYGKDICRQLADAAHKRGMRLGWYLSVREWNDSTCSHETLNHLYVEKLKGEIKELLTNYGKIDIMWFDHEFCSSSADPQTIFDYCRELQPDIIINNRLNSLYGYESHSYIGSYGMYASPEQFVGNYSEYPWESCSTSSSSRQFSIKFNDHPRPSKDMTWALIGAAGGNGNLLMNVGPDSLGVITQDYADTLAMINNWIKANDGVLYGTKGGPWKPTKSYVSTRKGKNVNIIIKDGNDISLPYNSEIDFDKAYILSSGESVQSKIVGDTISFTIPETVKGTSNLVIRLNMKSDALKIGVISPFPISGSLAYDKKITASSSLSDVFLYNPESAVDDDPRTRWIVGRRKDFDSSLIYGHYIDQYTKIGKSIFDDNGILEVDLGEAKEVNRIKIFTATRIAKTNIEFEHNQKWMTVDVADYLEKDSVWETTLSKPVKARKWRLRMSGGDHMMSIREFQIF